MADHKWFTNFDRRACEGTHPDVDGVCPLKEEGTFDTCGVCGCTLFGLNATDSPPKDCVRLEVHREDAADG